MLREQAGLRTIVMLMLQKPKKYGSNQRPTHHCQREKRAPALQNTRANPQDSEPLPGLLSTTVTEGPPFTSTALNVAACAQQQSPSDIYWDQIYE